MWSPNFLSWQVPPSNWKMNLQFDKIWQRVSGGRCYVGWISWRGESWCTLRRIQSDRWFKRERGGCTSTHSCTFSLYLTMRWCSVDWFYTGRRRYLRSRKVSAVPVQIRWFGGRLLTGHVATFSKERTFDNCSKLCTFGIVLIFVMFLMFGIIWVQIMLFQRTPSECAPFQRKEKLYRKNS